MDIVEEMRGFEVDHEPDGWPAVKMKQVSALCDEIDVLRAELQQLREQEPEFYYWRASGEDSTLYRGNYFGDERFAPLYAAPVPAMPIPKQEPIGKICKSAECGGVDFYFDKIPDGETMLYAGPQPAQAAAIPEQWREMVTDLANELESEVMAKYTLETLKYPSQKNKFDADMDSVHRARALISASPNPE